MIIKSIELADYRNYDSLIMQFDKGTNILYGDNAQGKTNILEAIYVAATTKSHRGSKDREIVNFDKEEAHIRTYLEKRKLKQQPKQYVLVSSIVLTAFHVNIYVKVSLIYFSLKSNK